MFEHWVTSKRRRGRLESNPLCNELALFAETLQAERYARVTLRVYLFAAAAFGRWVGEQGWTVEHVDDSRLQLYLSRLGRRPQRGYRHGRLPPAASGVVKLAEVLRARGAMPSAALRRPANARDRSVAAFRNHLVHVAGVSVGTCRIWHLCSSTTSVGTTRSSSSAP